MAGRVVVVCRDGAGRWSPGVAVDGLAGGGRAAVDLILRAAPGVPAGDPGRAAAAVCVALHRELGGDPPAARLSLVDAPRGLGGVGAGWEPAADLVVVDVAAGTVECLAATAPAGDPARVVVRTVRGLPLGG